MKKLVLGVTVFFLAASLVGCGKKKEESASMEGLNGVISENVVSVPDANAGNVAVVVDNAQVMMNETAALVEETVKTSSVSAKPTIKQIQISLKNAGFYSGKIDGTIGPKTKKAIEAFQEANGLKADGKVGPKTWKMLLSHLNSVPEVTNPSAEAQKIGQ